MNRQEPYIGMPIILASLDEDRSRRQPHQDAPQVGQQHPATPDAGCDMACAQTQTRQPMMLAMAYVPWQRWQETYPLEEGFRRGTIFPDLDLPFEGKRVGGMRR